MPSFAVNMEIGLGISMNIPDGADFTIFNQILDKVFKVRGDTNVVSVIEALSAHGNGNLGKYERAIELYNIANPDNPVRFYSNKGWAFGSGDADDFASVFEIVPDGGFKIEKNFVDMDYPGGAVGTSTLTINEFGQMVSKCESNGYTDASIVKIGSESGFRHGIELIYCDSGKYYYGMGLDYSGSIKIFEYTDDGTRKTVGYVTLTQKGFVGKLTSAPLSLGSNLVKWKEVYSVNGTIQTSDRNEKNTIAELTAEQAQSLIYGLKPSTYKMNAGTSSRTHWGIISQDIEELLNELGWTSLDFAGFIKSPKMTEIKYDEKTGKCIRESEVIEGEYDYSLRYDEFIAPIIKVVQTQHEEIENLKQDIDFLKQQMSDLLNKEELI